MNILTKKSPFLHRNRWQKYFSLVELLVVLTVISMLAIIIIPSLIKSRHQAQKTNCISNLKQLGIATKLYNQEYGAYPLARRKINPTNAKFWCFELNGTIANFAGGFMADYIQNPDILRCPTFTNFKAKATNKNITSSYGINAEYIGASPVPGANEDEILNNPSATNEEIKRPELTITFADSAELNGSLSESWLIWARYSYAKGDQMPANSHFRHDNRSVAVFCDGHCEENLKPDAIDNETHKLGWLEINKLKR